MKLGIVKKDEYGDFKQEKEIEIDAVATIDTVEQTLKEHGIHHSIGSEGICPYCKHRFSCLGSSFGPFNKEILFHPFARLGCDGNFSLEKEGNSETYKKIPVVFEYDDAGYNQYWKVIEG